VISKYSKQQKETLKKIGVSIRSSRINAGLSQEGLAIKSGLDRTYIGSVERGERNISIINMVKISKALDVRLTNLLKDL
jgi:transcriptional regulator with XRE-family HTH domain